MSCYPVHISICKEKTLFSGGECVLVSGGARVQPWLRAWHRAWRRGCVRAAAFPRAGLVDELSSALSEDAC